MLFGLSIFISPPQYTSGIRTTGIYQSIGPLVTGTIFSVIGVATTIGLFIKRNNYMLARTSIYIAAGWAMTLLIAFVLALLNGSLHGAFFVVLWGYLTYNLYYIAKDPGWTAIQIVDIVKEEENHGRFKS